MRENELTNLFLATVQTRNYETPFFANIYDNDVDTRNAFPHLDIKLGFGFCPFLTKKKIEISSPK